MEHHLENGRGQMTIAARLIALVMLVLLGTFPAMAQEPPAHTAQAVFAGGCFWCMEPPFDKLNGVISTTSGYAGGHVENPTYEQVGTGTTGHFESVLVTYNPDVVSYEKLLETYWANIDPLNDSGQFCDYGPTYRSVIFYRTDSEKQAAEYTKALLEKRLGERIDTRILPYTNFYPAEDYHQDYYQKNPARYKFYRWRCGRDARLEDLWGDRAGHSLSLFASRPETGAAD